MFVFFVLDVAFYVLNNVMLFPTYVWLLIGKLLFLCYKLNKDFSRIHYFTLIRIYNWFAEFHFICRFIVESSL